MPSEIVPEHRHRSIIIGVASLVVSVVALLAAAWWLTQPSDPPNVEQDATAQRMNVLRELSASASSSASADEKLETMEALNANSGDASNADKAQVMQALHAHQ